MYGKVKTVTIKRDSVQRLWVCFSVEEAVVLPKGASPSNVGGFDFGLKTFLTDNQKRAYANPQFLAKELHRVRKLNRAVWRKEEGSHNQGDAQRLLSRTHIRIADKRRDFHFKLANGLCEEYDLQVFEDLNLEGMKRLWGRKVSDWGFAKFITIIKHVALKRGKQ